MAEKRGRERKRKRVKLRFGQELPKRMAFTEDLSTGGLFVVTAQPEPPGTKLWVQLLLPEDGEVVARGRVQWAKKVPANLVHVARKAGMGIRFINFESGEQVFKDLISELRH